MFCVESFWKPSTTNKETDKQKNKNILVGPQKEEASLEMVQISQVSSRVKVRNHKKMYLHIEQF